MTLGASPLPHHSHRTSTSYQASSSLRLSPFSTRSSLHRSRNVASVLTALHSTAEAYTETRRYVEKMPMVQTSVPGASEMYTPRYQGASSLERATSTDFRRLTTNLTAASAPGGQRKACILFYTPDTEELARKVAAVQGSNITLGKIRWR